MNSEAGVKIHISVKPENRKSKTLLLYYYIFTKGIFNKMLYMWLLYLNELINRYYKQFIKLPILIYNTLSTDKYNPYK